MKRAPLSFLFFLAALVALGSAMLRSPDGPAARPAQASEQAIEALEARVQALEGALAGRWPGAAVASTEGP